MFNVPTSACDVGERERLYLPLADELWDVEYLPPSAPAPVSVELLTAHFVQLFCNTAADNICKHSAVLR